MKHLDLFSGIGGFARAARWSGWETVAFVEINDYCQNILQKNFPGVPIYADIRKFDTKPFRGRIDIITGGFPCQPFSVAGTRKGKEDERYLFPQMLRIIREVKPLFIVAENVPGLLSIENGEVFTKICSQLEGEGYDVWTFNIPASSVEAPHERQRIWIVANNRNSHSVGFERSEISVSAVEQQNKDCPDPGRLHRSNINAANPDSGGYDGRGQQGQDRERSIHTGRGDNQTLGESSICDCGVVANNPDKQGSQKGEQSKRTRHARFGNRVRTDKTTHKWSEPWPEVAARLCRVDDGLPDWLDRADRMVIYNAVGYFGQKAVEQRLGIDCTKVAWQVARTNRLKALGNSIVPQIAFEIFRALVDCETYEDRL